MGALPGSQSWLEECIARSQDGVFSETAPLLPSLAAELLGRNPNNRSIRQKKVHQYAADIREGLWQLNGEAIKISREGLLNDGQHRCVAVVEAKRPIEAVFTFGVERETRNTLDQGAARTAGDYLQMDGYDYGKVAAGCARLVIAYERKNTVTGRVASHITNSEQYRRAINDDDIFRSAKVGKRCSRRGILTSTLAAFLHYVFADIDEEEAEAFLIALARGENLTASDPVYAARERLINLDGTRRGDRVEIAMRAWNARREGRTLKAIQITGTLPELV